MLRNARPSDGFFFRPHAIIIWATDILSKLITCYATTIPLHCSMYCLGIEGKVGIKKSKFENNMKQMFSSFNLIYYMDGMTHTHKMVLLNMIRMKTKV